MGAYKRMMIDEMEGDLADDSEYLEWVAGMESVENERRQSAPSVEELQ